MTWRTAPGKSMDMPQREFLVRLSELTCSTFPSPTLVNIGVHTGCSMRCLRAGCPNATLIGVDVVGGKYFKAVEDVATRLILGDSNVVHVQVGPPIHFLFIDGGHAYQTVKGDVEGWIPKLAVGGIVAFHDLHMGGVITAFSEWRESDGESWIEIDDAPCPGFRAFRRTE